MPTPFYQVDAFTSSAFSGNPAAVYVLPTPHGATWMQRVAQEMNLSETAFVHRKGEATYRLRWFTPTHEVDLCGHATLASAHVLWAEEDAAVDAPLRFETAGGRLTARHEAAPEGTRIAMDFPTDPVTEAPLADEWMQALGLGDAVWTGRSSRDVLVQVATRSDVTRLSPDMAALQALDARGVIVTAAAEPDAPADFVSRFFAPGVGVPEDPVTGSAHCALAPFWAVRLGTTVLVGRQVSARGGTVRLRLDASDAERVTLLGSAVTVVRGTLLGDDA